MMTVAQIIALIAQLVPVASSLVDEISNAGVNTGSSADALALVAKLTPLAGSLVAQIEAIRDQTENQASQVWDTVRADWTATVQKWNALQSAS